MTITVFSTQSCFRCNIVKKHLTKRGLPYEEFRIEQSEVVADKLRELGFTSAPVVLIDEDDVMEGYHPDELDALIPEAELAAA